MPGFSITLLLLPHNNPTSDLNPALILSLLDEKADTPGWKWSSASPPLPETVPSAASATPPTEQRKPNPNLLRSSDPKAFIACIERACKALVSAEPEITQMDTIAGDGDCGLTLKVRAHHRPTVVSK
jgi:dihydroxyacetone kinase